MKYIPSDPRLDDPAGVAFHANRYAGGKALIVLGGYSASAWYELREEIKPDIVIGANGVNGMVYGLDYWLICENLARSNRLAKEMNVDAIAVMDMFHRDAGAKNKMVSWHSWSLLKNTKNCVKIRRQEYGDLTNFSFRNYDMGYLEGCLPKHVGQWQPKVEVNVGTVGLQCIHHAGILGCSEIHTIGYDLMFRDHERHHAYPYPLYKVDKFRSPDMFTNYKGVPTQWTWIETAQYLKTIEPFLKRDGITWKDHSNGLLKIEGVAQ